MKIAVITNCTATGSVPHPSYMDGYALLQKNSEGYTHDTAVAEWHKAIQESRRNNDGQCIVRQLYTGISFRTMLRVTDELQDIEHDLFVVSLGFGLINANDTITAYNLNLQEPEQSNSSLFNVVTKEAFEPIRWWAAINRSLSDDPTPLSSLIASGQYDLVIIALTNVFLDLVARDVAQSIPTKEFENVRIVGPRGTNWMLKYLRQLSKTDAIMPYSNVLNDMVPGNRNDFAQRAALHFITTMSPDKFLLPAKEQAGLIASVMQAATKEAGADIEEVSKYIDTLKNEDLSPQEAFVKVQKKFGTRLGFAKFEVMWGAKKSVEVADDALEDALAAVKEIGIQPIQGSDFEVIQELKIFVQALRSQGGGEFTVGDICKWAKIYHDRRQEPIPDTLARPNKLGRLLPNLCEDLNIIRSDSGSGLGPRTYRVEGDDHE